MTETGHWRSALSATLSLSLLLPSVPLSAHPSATPTDEPSPHSSARKPYHAGQLRGDERILHALNRFTFGPQPGDLETVRQMGLEKWFIQQLHPESIDNSGLGARLTQFPAMQWSPQDLLYRLPSNAIIRQAADGKLQVPANGALRSIYLDEIARYQSRQQQKEQEKRQLASNAVTMGTLMDTQPMRPEAAGAGSPSMGAPGRKAEPGPTSMLPPTETPSGLPPPDDAQIASILALPPAQRVARLAAMPQPEFDSFRKALKGPQRLKLTTGLTPAEKEIAAALEGPQRVVSDELAAERLTRNIYSNAQLQEVMTDFWLNHFNVYLHKNEETPYYLVSYERDVVRPRALGKFEDLLEGTAHSPAMLLYLDNTNSMGPDSPAAEKAKVVAARRPDSKKAAPEGLNENYARELMELHTLGVNGGYTQADVTQVARVLTGWSVDKPQRGGGFKFDETRHEPGTKKVLGKKIKEHGELEGRELLHMLATRPATAKFIARKLAIRFVGDDPPQSVVDRMAKAYLSSDGDISEVLKTLFHAPEFWAPDAYRAKIKTPLEYVASAARASNASIDSMQPLVNALRDMGMPIYGAVPPTGYKWDAADWVSTGALVNRMNFALTLAAGKMQGVAVSWKPQNESMQSAAENDGAQREPSAFLIGPMTTPETEEQRLEASLVAGGLSDATRAALLNQFSAQMQAQGVQTPPSKDQPLAKPFSAANKPNNPAQLAALLDKQDQLLAGLLLGSPEFQRR